MPETFLQQVRRLYAAQEQRYNADRSAWFQPEHRTIMQMARQGRITKDEEAYYHSILNSLEQLSFQKMIAARSGNTRQLVGAVAGTAQYNGKPITDSKLPQWGVIETILQSAKVDATERWLLNFLYMIEEANRVPSTSEQTAPQCIVPQQPETPTTEPFGPFPSTIKRIVS